MTGLKALFGLCDLATFVVLWRLLPWLGRPRELACLHGLCPLLALEFAGEGHSDSLAALGTVLALAAAARGRAAWAGIALALATAAKLLPAVLLPFFVRRAARGYVAFVLALLALYAPFLGDGDALLTGASEYAARWRSNDTCFALLYAAAERLVDTTDAFWEWEPQRLAKVPLAALAACVWLALLAARSGAARAGLLFLLFTFAFAPALHPWYLALLVPFLCVYPNVPLLAFTGSVYLAYHVLPSWRAQREWSESSLVKAIEYAPFYLGVAIELLRSREPAARAAAALASRTRA